MLVSGMLLVAFIMVLNLTVSTGTINGLIFYANIVRASHNVFFPPVMYTHSGWFLNIFIAWLNLDLGIETCFYNGLDAYAKTWLQFFFPLYIWLVVTVIIIASHYSTTASRLSGNNAVQVLATLFLLSYTKIIRVVITVFSSTVLVYPDGFTRRVWLYDGNVDFLKGKHVPLFIATLILFVLVTVPFTLSLVGIQWLQRISHLRILFWIRRLMPLFDAYTGPYKHRHRYWTGVLLMVRVLVLFIFSFNYSNDPAYNLRTIAIVIFALLTYLTCIGQIYKKKVVNLMEILSLVNIEVFALVSLHQIMAQDNQVIVTYISTSITFTLFTLIVFWHAFQRLKNLRKMKHAVLKVSKVVDVIRMRGGRTSDMQLSQNQMKSTDIDRHTHITHSSLSMQECLLQQDTESNSK